MKKLLYPKIYATIIDFTYENGIIYVVKNGKVVFNPNITKIIFIFETDNGEIIEAKYPRTSGHTPYRVWKEWYERDKSKQYKVWDYLLGCKVKLYKRPQDNGRWSYRHLGE